MAVFLHFWHKFGFIGEAWGIGANFGELELAQLTTGRDHEN